MTKATVQLPGRPFQDWIQDIYLHRKTGVLALNDESKDSLFFIAGDLYLDPEHTLFDQASVWIQAPSSFKELAIEILSGVADLSAANTRFQEGAAQIRIDLVGPLPTSQLIMESTVWEADEGALLRQLGGEDTILIATTSGRALPDNVDLDPHEAFLLSRLESSQSVSELLHQLDIEKKEILRKLCRLNSIDLLRQERDSTEES